MRLFEPFLFLEGQLGLVGFLQEVEAACVDLALSLQSLWRDRA